MRSLQPGWLTAQLPRVLAEDDLLVRFVGALEGMATEARAPLDGLEHLVDVDLAPAPFVRWLGSWLGLPVEEGLPERRQREVVRAAGRQFPWRGTQRGVRELLEAYTGHEVRVEDSGGIVPLDRVSGGGSDRRVTIHVRGAGGIDEHHLLRLVEQEVPADATVELRIEDHAVEAEAQPGQLTEEPETAEEPAAGPGPMEPRRRPPPSPDAASGGGSTPPPPDAADAGTPPPGAAPSPDPTGAPSAGPLAPDGDTDGDAADGGDADRPPRPPPPPPAG